MKYLPLDPQIFIQNRKRFAERMKPNAIAIFHAHPEIAENSDAIYQYKPNSNMVWLSGILQTHSQVILYPDNPDREATEVLIIQRPDELTEKWNGHLLRKEEARKISGIQKVLYADEYDRAFKNWMINADRVYLDSNENDHLSNETFRTDLLFLNQFKAQYPLHRYERAARIFRDLRSIKTKEEIKVVQKAIDITHKTFLEVLKMVHPGVMEYEIEATVTYHFLKNRATRHAYEPIIASGDRARILHYIDNSQECKDGELILMDWGAEYGNYNADMSRTIPVNGKFTKRQKEIYDACLSIQQYCASILKPGINYQDYTQKLNQKYEEVLQKIGLISSSDIKNQDPENPAYRKYFYHGIGHHLGLDVHDIGPIDQPVQPGMLFTIEPGIYIEEEQMGIRIENNYLITKDGNIDLFKGVPITTEEIEAAMKK